MDLYRKAFAVAVFFVFTVFQGHAQPEEIYVQNKQMPKIDDVRVSSTLPHKADKFIGAHLVDGSTRSWVDGVKGPGIGERIFIDFEAPVHLTHFYIKNGFGDPTWHGAKEFEKVWPDVQRSNILQNGLQSS